MPVITYKVWHLDNALLATYVDTANSKPVMLDGILYEPGEVYLRRTWWTATPYNTPTGIQTRFNVSLHITETTPDMDLPRLDMNILLDHALATYVTLEG